MRERHLAPQVAAVCSNHPAPRRSPEDHEENDNSWSPPMPGAVAGLSNERMAERVALLRGEPAYELAKPTEGRRQGPAKVA
jgi:hypothetical protein